MLSNRLVARIAELEEELRTRDDRIADLASRIASLGGWDAVHERAKIKALGTLKIKEEAAAEKALADQAAKVHCDWGSKESLDGLH